MAAQDKGIDLASIFQSVMGQLQNKKDELNKADQYNHDHGDNMVDTFKIITQAMKEKQGASPADQLAYASQLLKERQSGSSQLYANGLSQAAQQFEGQQQVTPNNAMTLIQTLLGGGQAPMKQQEQQAGGLGGILGSLFGSGKAAWDNPASGGKAAWDRPAFGGKAAWDQKPEAAPAGKGNVPADPNSIDVLLAGLPPGWKGTLDPESGDIRMETPYGFEPVAPKNLRDYVKWAQNDAASTAKTQQSPAQQAPTRQQIDDADDMAGLPPGGINLQDIINTVVSNSASNSGYRQESGSIVARAVMQAIQGLLKK